MENEIVLKLFLETQLKKDSEKVLNALYSLRPINLNLANIIYLYEWIEDNYKTDKFPYRHVNIFGTGGDKTINISTISSIIASKYVNVVKVGTRAVTSNWGSFDFINELKNSDNKDPIYYDDKSTYIGLPDLGYYYSQTLIKARRILHSNSELDVYKLLFPLVNLTNAVAQISGVHRIEYLNYYLYVYKELKKTGAIVYNDNDIDEIYFGRNYLYFFVSGKLIERKTVDINHKTDEDLKYFQESENITDHITKFKEIRDGKVSPSIRKVIILNVALILMAYDLFEHPFEHFYNEVISNNE